MKQGVRLHHADHWVCRMPCLWERFEPPCNGPDLSTHGHGWEIAFEKLNYQRKVASCDSVLKRLLRQVMGQIPPRRSAMERGDLLGATTLKLVLEELGEELVIAEPLAAII
jgi:hypothetical protein